MNDLNRLDLNLLRAFDVLMEERSVSRASDRLCLTQSATSNALARLRQVIGDPLMVRQGNRMVPTPIAEELHPHVRRAMRDISQGLDKLHAFSPEELTGPLRIGIDQYCLHLLGTRLVSKLRVCAPRLTVSVVNAPPHERETLLLKGEFDFIVGQVWQQTPQVSVDVLFSENFVGVMRKGHPFARQDTVTLDQYLSVDHLLFSEVGQVPRNVDLGLRRIGQKRTVRTTVPSFSVLGGLLEDSDAILNIGSRMARALQSQYELEIFTLPISVPDFDVGVLWPEKESQLQMNQWFRSIMREVSA